MRFKEFNEDWKETALEDLTMKTYRAFAGGPFGSNLKSCDYTDKGIPIIQLGNITEDYLNFKDRLIFTSIKKADELIASNAYSGDLIIAKMMPAGRACIASDLYPRYVLGSDGIRVCLDKEKCNIIFIRDQINSEKIKKEISSKTAGSTRQRIGIPELKKVKLLVPCIDEQNKIGDLLSLLEKRIEAQNKIIEDLNQLIYSIRCKVFKNANWETESLKNLCDSGIISLKRGNIIPKKEKSVEAPYPVYSSSTQNNGLMGYHTSYMFDKELITWSIDGGGTFFHRKAHKFNVTNVCGIMEIDTSKYNYGFLYEYLTYQHSKLIFDYQSKAHPSTIIKLYNIPIICLEKQEEISKVFTLLYDKIEQEKSMLSLYREQKAYLLKNLFI